MFKYPLNLHSLKYFCDAVNHGSISASAKKNFVSQSAISQAITKLETILEVMLITHEPNRFKPTPEGLLLFEKCKKVFEATQDLEDAFISNEENYIGQMEFACMHSFALAMLPKYINSFKKHYPGVQLNFRLGHTDIIKELLKKGAIDFGIVLDNDDFSSFDKVKIHKGEYRLYISNKQKKDNLPFILSEERIETNILKDAYFKKHQKHLKVLMEVSSWEVIAKLTEEGLGIGFFPDYVALKREDKIKEITLGIEPIEYKILAIFPKSKKLHKNTVAFLDHFKS